MLALGSFFLNKTGDITLISALALECLCFAAKLRIRLKIRFDLVGDLGATVLDRIVGF
jgi:hypothetical protein